MAQITSFPKNPLSSPTISEITETNKKLFNSPESEIESISLPTDQSLILCELEDLRKKMSSDSDWDVQVNAMKKFMGFVKSGALRNETFKKNIIMFYDGISGAIVNLRSALVKQSCLVVSQLAKEMGSSFDQAGDYFTPLSSQLSHGTQIISESCLFALLNISKHCPSKKIMASIFDLGTKKKGAAQHSAAAECLVVAVNNWDFGIFENNYANFYSVLIQLLNDASVETRKHARNIVRALMSVSPIRTNELMTSNDIDERTKKAILTENDDFKVNNTIKDSFKDSGKQKIYNNKPRIMRPTSEKLKRNNSNHINQFAQYVKNSHVTHSCVSSIKNNNVNDEKLEPNLPKKSLLKPLGSIHKKTVTIQENQNKNNDAHFFHEEKNIKNRAPRSINKRKVSISTEQANNKVVVSPHNAQESIYKHPPTQPRGSSRSPRNQKINETNINSIISTQNETKYLKPSSSKEKKVKIKTFDLKDGKEVFFLNEIQSTLAEDPNVILMPDNLPKIAAGILKCITNPSSNINNYALSLFNQLFALTPETFGRALPKIFVLLLSFPSNNDANEILLKIVSHFPSDQVFQYVFDNFHPNNINPALLKILKELVLKCEHINQETFTQILSLVLCCRTKEFHIPAQIIVNKLMSINKVLVMKFVKQLSPKEQNYFEQHYINNVIVLPKPGTIGYKKALLDIILHSEHDTWESVKPEILHNLNEMISTTTEKNIKTTSDILIKIIENKGIDGFDTLIIGLLSNEELYEKVIESLITHSDFSNIVKLIKSFQFNENNPTYSEMLINFIWQIFTAPSFSNNSQDILNNLNVFIPVMYYCINSENVQLRQTAVQLFALLKVLCEKDSDKLFVRLTEPQQKLVTFYYNKLIS